ncbi:hypothetical protein O6H91_09G067900 [Diphasiastrum complanatum]|uniref:Uncharacterized protein n=1 Tax=Diphasiastrum complanatum TaxID=34168 RepID=A0ACC2CQ95_DIPCM|nr:hypothetical protein O6H91_09G067900 [Diphasiastrum complanatum]
MRNLQKIWKLNSKICRSIRRHDLKESLDLQGICFSSSPSSPLPPTFLSHSAASLRRRSISSAPPSSSSRTADSRREEETTLSASEAVSRVFATPSVFGPAWQSCSYEAWQLLLNTSSFSFRAEAIDDVRICSNISSSEIGQGKLRKNESLDLFWFRSERNRSFGKKIFETSSVLPHFSEGLTSLSVPKIVQLGLPPSRGAFHGKLLHTTSCTEWVLQLTAGLPVDRTNLVSLGDYERTILGDDFSSLRLSTGACCLPHPNKEHKGGEDAFFICSSEQVIGVADGVGGWADVGVDAGEYARELMAQSQLAVVEEPTDCIEPARILARAHSRTKCRGSSTACILALSKDGLRAANLGDSGFIVVRNGQTVFKSPPQQHWFNIPYQLENGGSDPPSAAEVFQVQVFVGDVIVAGTDGLFDNVYSHEVTSVIMQSTRIGLSPEDTAKKVASLARIRAQDRNRQTPFSTAAQDAGYRFYGGKMDDITVIVAYIINGGPLDSIKRPT